MEERHLVAPRTGPWPVVDEVDAGIAGPIEGGRDIVGPQREMVDAGPVTVEIIGDRSLGVRFEQFEVAPLDVEKHHHHTVEPFLVDDRCVEEGGVAVGEPRGVGGGDPGVVETHTDRLAAGGIKINPTGAVIYPIQLVASAESHQDMIVTTTDTVPGRQITTTHGIVRGYTELSTESRERAEKRMEEEARAMGADAIVAVRFMTGSDSDGADEVLAYGTAVSLG